MALRTVDLLQILAFFACFSISLNSQVLFNQRNLQANEQVIVDDFNDWFSDNIDRVSKYMPAGISEIDLRNIAYVSKHARYFVVDNVVFEGKNFKWQRIADANPIIHRIRFYSDTNFWKYYFKVYNQRREKFLESGDLCGKEFEDFLYTQSKPFGVICHESAHLIHIRDHDTVYQIGYACEAAVLEDYQERIDACSLTVELD